MLYQVKYLPPEQKHAAEILLGYPVAEKEAVSIKSVDSSTIIPSKFTVEKRMEAFKALNERFARTPRPEFSDAEEEAAVNEALRSTRPNYRPIG